MQTLWQDIRYGARMLWKRPGFTAVAVLTLALGVGANTAIYTVIDAALLRSLPYAEPGRLVHLWEARRLQDFSRREASYPDYLDWRQAGDAFESVGGYTGRRFSLAGAGGTELLDGASVTANFFDVLGVRPQLGRAFLPGEDEAGAERVAVITHGMWQSRFGADPSVVGREISLGGRAHTVVGVLPREFQFAKAGGAEVWTALSPSPEQRSRRYWHWLNVVARLKDGVTPEEAEARVQTVARRIVEGDPESHAETAISVVPLRDEIAGAVRPILYLLLAAVGLVLLIACTNVANLMLTRAASRRKEIAIRVALGASRRRIVRQLLTESVMLSTAGGALGLVLALWGVDLLVAAIPPAQLAQMPYLRDLSLDAGVLAFTAGLSLLTGLLFGLTPAFQASKPDVNDVMKEGGRSSSAGGAKRLRDLLVVSEVAVALVLLVGAGLLVKSLARMLSVDPGFRTENLLTMKLALPPSGGYADERKAAAFHQELLGRVESLPGVRGAASVGNFPLSGDGGTGTPQIVGRAESTGDFAQSHLRTVSPGYFRVMGVPLVAGRDFTERDDASAPMVVVVNRTFAERVFPGEEPMGRRMTFKFTAELPPFEIVGVVGDEKVTSLDARTTPVIYFPYLQGPEPVIGLVVRTDTDPEGLAGVVREQVRALEPAAPVFSVQTMDALIHNSSATFVRRYPAYLVGVFAAVALLLAVVGIYGVISYSVSQRTHEIAIRMALGAQRRDVLRLVLRHGMLLAAGGVALGLAGALALTRLLSSMLFGVSAADPSVYAGVAALLASVALLACYLPARRATKVDPMEALRYE
jgi:predicted permease